MMNPLTFLFFGLTLASTNQEFLQEFVDGNNLFAGAVYKQVQVQKKHTGNFAISPFSTETAMALAQSGARGKTGQEIRAALHFPRSSKEVESAFQLLPRALQENGSYSFVTANKIYINETVKIKPTFNEIAAEVYKASTESINFSQRKEAANTINDWVAKQTKDKIRDIIDAKRINEDTAAIIINALYFQGQWNRNFKRGLTKEATFYKMDGQSKVDMMRTRDFFNYYEDSDLQATFLDVPFKAINKASMVIVLPNQRLGLRSLEGRLDNVFGNHNFTLQTVHVTLPKFKIETTLDFKKILKKLGVRKAFYRADFSGLAGEKGDIRITNIVQKTFISVNEEGVEAAAATAAFLNSKSLVDGYGIQKHFIADHPFIFYIKVNDVVIFVGRVLAP